MFIKINMAQIKKKNGNLFNAIIANFVFMKTSN